jgi:hypothetical protein
MCTQTCVLVGVDWLELFEPFPLSSTLDAGFDLPVLPSRSPF